MHAFDKSVGIYTPDEQANGEFILDLCDSGITLK